MSESVSDADLQAVKPPPKRRRILDPSAIVPVPVYSSKVSSSLQLKPTAAMLTGKAADDGADDTLWSQFSSRGPPAAVVGLSDSEEDEAEHGENKPEHTKKTTEPEVLRSPSPPPPESPVQKQSRRVKQKISEVDRKLRAVTSLLSPEPHDRTPLTLTCLQPMMISSVREIPLKVRCRTDVHKIPVLSSTPLSDVLTQLSVILDIPPPRLLLLKEEVELPTHSTVGELGLGIADIIECVVMAAEERHGADSSIVSVRLQSRDRDSSQEFSLRRDAPLGSVFSQYLSRMSSAAQRSVRFQFDGSKVSHSQTPAELDMEDGDIIEVWI
ncbi:NFATC2-interacting protein [Larimichthys crocea]|uniref:NFATC2-interacting protein n=1 Tax=Larimichthys crocea TaxID=215358 RepID=A0A6G0HUL8_LARCR|nr:NFATC2-interacting protein [Larimichthys crocea]